MAVKLGDDDRRCKDDVVAAQDDPSDTEATLIQGILDALSSPIRREILWMVWDAELPAGEIAAAFDVTAPTISSHLGALRNAGLVTMRADGNFRRYRADRRAMEAVVPLLASTSDRWQVADDLPESDLAESTIEHWVTVSATIARTKREVVFDAFTDSATYSAWLGVPVSISNGRFAAELEWGTKIRGHYELSLIHI